MSEKTSISSSVSSGSSSFGGVAENVGPFVDLGAPLPEGYGETRIVLLPRDPHWMYAYWEVTEQTVRDLKSRYGEDIFVQAQPTLRMHEAQEENNGSVIQVRSVRHLDVSVSLEARSWYLYSDIQNLSWFVELGLKTPDGRFIVIAKSNLIRMPNGRVSDITDEKWVSFKEEFDKVFQASGGGKVGMGSLELARMISQRWEMLSQVSSWKGSGGISSFGAPAPVQEGKARGFWLVADCELILYGATETTATVTVAGKPVELNPDGTFSLRFALPDGNLALPVRAVSGDRVETREIRISVHRKTEKD